MDVRIQYAVYQDIMLEVVELDYTETAHRLLVDKAAEETEIEMQQVVQAQLIQAVVEVQKELIQAQVEELVDLA